MRGESRNWVWRCAVETTPANSAPVLPRKRPPVRAIRPCAAVEPAISCKNSLKVSGRQGQILPHPVEIARFRLFACGDIHDDSGNQRLGFVVPMAVFCVAAVQQRGRRPGSRRPRRGRDCRALIKASSGLKAAARLAGDAEGIEDEDLAKGAAPAGGNSGVFALGVDDERRAVREQQIRDDRADALAVRVGARVKRWLSPV